MTPLALSLMAPDGAPADGIPLGVDLDGTICLADTLAWLRARAASLGTDMEQRRVEHRALSKQAEKVFLWEEVGLDLDDLPFDDDLVAALSDARDAGRPLVLVTGSAQGLAEAVAERLQIFEDTLGTSRAVNLTGPHKAAALVNRFGERGYDYLGDSVADLPVWTSARQGYVVWRPSTTLFQVHRNVVRIDSERDVEPPPSREGFWVGDDYSGGTPERDVRRP
jgi:phosphoserine phosphatase